MGLEERLASELVRAHPERAAAVLERVGAEAAAGVLAACGAREAAAVVKRLSPQYGSDVLARLGVEDMARLLDELDLDFASRLARRLADDRAAAVFERLSARRVRALRALLGFPENSAGALMDPEVLALPEHLTAGEALERVRETPDRARYNLYVVDADQVLVGVLNLRELFLAPPDQRLSELMVRSLAVLEAHADRSVVVSHPGWREVHQLPVVDERRRYLGAVRYRTLRQLEDALLRRGRDDGSAQQALGQLFAAGAGGLLDALTGPGGSRGGGH